MIPKEKVKAETLDWVDTNHKRLSDFHLEIWNYAETAWREYRSAKAYVELLRGEGFDVEEGSGDMPTAFVATWGEEGPVLGSFAEYDAVPGFSQQPVPYRAPREGLHTWAPGHTDPHSALGVAALTGVLAAKHAMEKHNLKGTLRLFGEPAEKVCGSKPVHAAKGYYDGADAYIFYHPSHRNSTILDTQSGSYWSCVFTFEPKDSEPWVDPSLLAFPDHPHRIPRSPGAVDALCLMYTMTKYTKENMFPHTGLWVMNEFIMVGGQCTSDNHSPKIGQIQYAWRSPSLQIQQQLYSVLENNAKRAAETTNTKVHVRWVAKTRVGLPNHVLANLTYRNLEKVGPPQFNEEAKEFARQIQKELGISPMEEPFLDTSQILTTPLELDQELQHGIPGWQKHLGSDDFVEYTWHAPSARLYTAKAMIREQPDRWAHWGSVAMTGFPPSIDPIWIVAGKTMAATFVDLLLEPDVLEQAKREFEERTGGGVGGEKWVAPLLPSDFKPPVDLRWPEYINTVRGEEWWIPTDEGYGESLC
jgi:aminobenzoyl-glutamate utilization protein B